MRMVSARAKPEPLSWPMVEPKAVAPSTLKMAILLLSMRGGEIAGVKRNSLPLMTVPELLPVRARHCEEAASTFCTRLWVLLKPMVWRAVVQAGSSWLMEGLLAALPFRVKLDEFTAVRLATLPVRSLVTLVFPAATPLFRKRVFDRSSATAPLLNPN